MLLYDFLVLEGKWSRQVEEFQTEKISLQIILGWSWTHKDSSETNLPSNVKIYGDLWTLAVALEK